MSGTIFEVAEQAARKLRAAVKKPRKASKARVIRHRKQAGRSSGRVRKSSGKGKRKAGR